MLDDATIDYIMDLYWTNYGAILSFVNKEMFLQAKRTDDQHYYSRSLYLSILAVGFRYADHSRPDMQAIQLPNARESKLLGAAKQLLEEELESTKGLPRIQALILVGDAEASAGRHNIGWMYIGSSIPGNLVALCFC